MSIYADYKGKRYPFVMKEGKYRLRSRVKEMDFEEIIDLEGKCIKINL